MTSTTLHREVGVVSGLKKEIASLPRNVMALLLDVHRDKSGTMRRRRLAALRLVLIEKIDVSIYKSTDK